MRRLVFILVSIVLSPLMLVGTVIYMFRVRRALKQRGVDGTTYEPFTARLAMHDLGTRSDPVARRLASHLTVTAPPVWSLFGLPMLSAARLSGHVPTVFDFPPDKPRKLMSVMTLRTEFFDRTLESASGDVAQVVILGAGWDTRAYNASYSKLRFFEVDEPATQQEKQEALASAAIDASHVTFVPLDFNEKSWRDELVRAGFDPDLPTYVLWEGVSMYLDQNVIEETLRTVAGFAPGSMIAFDYLPRELFTSGGLYGLIGRYIKFGMPFLYGTEFKLFFPGRGDARDEVASILTRQNLELRDFEVLAYRTRYPVYGFALANNASATRE